MYKTDAKIGYVSYHQAKIFWSYAISSDGETLCKSSIEIISDVVAHILKWWDGETPELSQNDYFGRTVELPVNHNSIISFVYRPDNFWASSDFVLKINIKHPQWKEWKIEFESKEDLAMQYGIACAKLRERTPLPEGVTFETNLFKGTSWYLNGVTIEAPEHY